MVSSRAKNIQPSLTLELAAQIRKKKAEGIDVVSFTAGEPDFPSPQVAISAAQEAMEGGKTRYTPAAGLDKLRSTAADWLNKQLGVPFSAEEVLVSCGAKHAIFNLFLSLLEEGDEVLLPAPFWLTYPEQIRLVGGKVVPISTSWETQWKITPEQLKKAITPRTRAVVLNTPNNPTGAVYTKEELLPLLEILENHNLYLITDEIYSPFVYPPHTHYSPLSLAPQLRDRTFIVHGVSKAYAMTGWRIGFLAGPKPFIQAASSIQSHTTSNPCSVAQYAAIAALEKAEGEMRAMAQAFQERKEVVCYYLRQLDGAHFVEPQGTFYAFLVVESLYSSLGSIRDSLSFAKKLLEEAHVGVVPGAVFGADEGVRISFACSPKELHKGMERLCSFWKKQQQTT